ncbi:SdrD B-like domain-containing protein [Roseateles puraquae]|uniref:Uncharacterized protein n=1 Tax=Roseateles puraquae TaxID=431059 RepID=A0A254N9P0_9BURK|nr:SdrD B-like domain-containing protein [Roseateles puraquae]MDG0854058.1 hypothetical protein [Roseateles puraquae]OWR03522.1 hypothetical protein CDO81_13580 [Roseateles puraquae]
MSRRGWPSPAPRRAAHRLTVRARGLLVTLLGLAMAERAWAQAAVAPAAPAPYVDRVLDDGPQPDPAPGAGADARSGWPRGVVMDYALTQATGLNAPAQSLSLRAYLEPPGYGALSLACLAEFGRADRRQAGCAKARFDWRRVPMDADAWADLAAGDILALAPDVGQGYARVLAPPLPLTGASAQWHRGETASLNLAAGRASSPTAFSPISAWAGSDEAAGWPLAVRRARVVSGGGQLRLGDPSPGATHLDLAAQLLDARDVPADTSGQNRPGLARTRAVWVTAAWEGNAPWSGTAASAELPPAERPGGMRVQASLLRSQTSAALDRARAAPWGGWLEADWRTERLSHNAGVYHLQPGLQWGTAPVLADLQGGYWRARMQTRRWFAGWTVEASRPTTRATAGSRYASAYGSWRLDARQSVGATVSARDGSGRGQSLQLRWDALSSWGQTTARLERLDTAVGRTQFIGADHAWHSTTTRLLTTSLGWQHSGIAGNTGGEWSWGVLFSDAPLSRLQIDLSLTGTLGPQRRTWFADVAAQWQLHPDWSLALRYARTGTISNAPTVTSPLETALTPAATSTQQHFAQVLLRFQAQAGLAVAPLGGRAGDGAGDIQGTVYLDADANGRQDAGEHGAADVVVVLDGRYLTRTDGAGQFSFGPVAAGRHTLQVQTETVPLPWAPPQPSLQTVWVPVRSVARVPLGLPPLR